MATHKQDPSEGIHITPEMMNIKDIEVQKVSDLRVRNIKEWNREVNREYINITLKERTCCHCGMDNINCLDFYHRDPKSLKYKISKLQDEGYGLEVLKKEILKCRVHCANCQCMWICQEENSNRELATRRPPAPIGDLAYDYWIHGDACVDLYDDDLDDDDSEDIDDEDFFDED